jgi:NTP pyrophosphatase (non-canonical NTP hydrolase)
MKDYEIVPVEDKWVKQAINTLAEDVKVANRRWWVDIHTGQPVKRNKGEMLMLIVSEIAEAMEGERKDLMDAHLPHRKMAEVELADAMIRILDYCAAHDYDLGGAFVEKMRYNAQRKDHTHEERLKPGGKKF